MSQHRITTHAYDIVVGWDRPLQYFFGTVWDKANFEVVLTTLSLPGGGVNAIEELADFLRPYIDLPEEIRSALKKDQVANRGNLVRRWKL